MFESNKEQLKDLADSYKLNQADFNLRHEEIINNFNLKKNARKQVRYGMLAPSNSSLKKYTETLNSNSRLNKLHGQINQLLLSGNIIIIKLIYNEGISISGYNLRTFLEKPEENFQEIYNLIQGLGGAEHIHIINEKVSREIPARHYLFEHSKLLELIDYWIKELEIFDDE